MADLKIPQPEAEIGVAPVQQLHVIDDRDLRVFEEDGFTLYLALAIALIPCGIGVGATLAAWRATIPQGTEFLSSWWALIFLLGAVSLIAAGFVLLIPACRNFRKVKTLIHEIRGRRVPPKGFQQPVTEGSSLDPVIRSTVNEEDVEREENTDIDI